MKFGEFYQIPSQGSLLLMPLLSEKVLVYKESVRIYFIIETRENFTLLSRKHLGRCKPHDTNRFSFTLQNLILLG